MANWRVKKASWFSPRAIQEPTSRVEEVRTGPNSVRYQAKEPMRLETKIQNPGLTYAEYKKQRKVKRNQWADDAYDVWEGEQLVHYNKPTYAFEASRWSNWSYNSYFGANDANDTSLFVKSPESYLTPGVDLITSKTNYWLAEDINRIKELSRVCYLKMIDDRDFIADRFKDPNNGLIHPNEWQKKVELYENVYETYIPGFTPLEQAIAFQHKYREMKSKADAKKSGAKYESKKIEFRRSDYADPILNTQLDMNRFNKRYKLDILNKVSIIGDLGVQFKVEKGMGEKEVANSEIFRKKHMRSYDQVRMIEMYQRMLPTFKAKFLTKDLIVNVPVQMSEQKQKIIILCDQSGSMNDCHKQQWVNALLTDRFRYVILGEAEVFFSFFTSSTECLEFKHVKNLTDVKNFWMNFSNNPGGSLTDIGYIVNYIAEQITVKHRLHNLDVDLSKELPEILIINDGEDKIGHSSFPYKVNAISLVSFSNELKRLCINSGGKQVKVTKDDKVVAYSKDLEEVISE
jgi:hypothetical protein